MSKKINPDAIDAQPKRRGRPKKAETIDIEDAIEEDRDLRPRFVRDADTVVKAEFGRGHSYGSSDDLPPAA